MGGNHNGEHALEAKDEYRNLHGAIVFRIGYRRKAALLKVFTKALTD
jgi:hypothetical protein